MTAKKGSYPPDIAQFKHFGGHKYQVALTLGEPSLFMDKWKAESRAKSYRVVGWLARVVEVGTIPRKYVIYVREKR